ncbi:MAG: LysR family transcriptional regulator [Marinibacterium sp.]|nr:LysR family transcriptional regulator [Marinibacterium sp.]
MSQYPNRIRRLKHIEAFSAVISTGSISGAARQLGVSQPAVSQLVKALEDAIGAPLFVRRNGAIYPTNRAEALREDAIALLAQLERFQAQLSHRRTGLLSTIRVSASMSILNELLPELFSNLNAAHPDLKFYVSSVPLSEMVIALLQGHIDFALHSRAIEHPGLNVEKIREFKQVAILPEDSPLAKKDRIAITDLNGCRFISSTKNDPSYHELNDICRRAEVSMNTVFQSPFASLSIEMVKPMNAVALSSELIARLVAARIPGLVIRDVDGIDLKTPIYLACADWQNDTETQQFLREQIIDLIDGLFDSRRP